MRPIWPLALLLLQLMPAHAQVFDPHYQPLHSRSLIQDKDFYFFTLLEQPAARDAIRNDTFFARKLDSLRQMLSYAAKNRSRSPLEVARSFGWGEEDIAAAANEFSSLPQSSPKAAAFLVEQIRRSGYWIRDSGLADAALLAKAWEGTARAENHLIICYTTNKGFRYPAIDSATFSPSSPISTEMYGETLMMLWHKKDSLRLFFQPGLELALDILFLNGRDEAIRFEPMNATNGAAYRQVGKTRWAGYPYAAILIPGEGPENGWPMSPVAKYRCQLGAEAYRKGKAPFIIVSGGYVHPFQTPYCEADQMRTYLVTNLGIPPGAIIMEPHARHTTTNFRNAARIMIRQGFPVSKRVLCVSTAGQISYIAASFFALRCRQELGYIPFRSLELIDPFTVSFLVETGSLQVDATDLLDP